MPKILIVDNDPAERNARNLSEGRATTGGNYAEVLDQIRDDLEISIIAPYDGDETPDLTQFDGVVFTGSGVEWNTDDARAKPLADVMRAVFGAGLPTIGSCNGMQLAASVLGGSTGESPNGREDGIARDIALTDAGKAHPMLVGRTDGYGVPCVHRDEVRALPDGAVLLATNAHSQVQAFAYDKDGVDFWGMQYHPELSCEILADGLSRYGRGDGEFLADLKAAPQDNTSAARVGTTSEEQQFQNRTVELQNWLARF